MASDRAAVYSYTVPHARRAGPGGQLPSSIAFDLLRIGGRQYALRVCTVPLYVCCER